MAINKIYLNTEIKSKKKKVSKKSKRSWRKYSDIKDVEEFLEISRFEERTGGAAAEKEDSLLYFVDKKDVAQKNLDACRNDKLTLKCHSSLVNNELTTPRASRQSSMKKIKNLDEKYNKRLSKHIKKASNAPKKEATEKNSSSIYDIWGTSESSFVDVHNAKVCRKMPVKVPWYHSQKPSGLPAVPLPHPGMSYNPTFEQHQELLSMAIEIEIKKDKLEQKVFQATDAKYPKADEAPNQLSWLKEMSEGLPDVDISLFHQKLKDKKVEQMEDKFEKEVEDDIEGGSADVVEGDIIQNKPIWRGDKKTEKQRRKQMIEKEKKLMKQREKLERLKKDESSRIKSIKKEVRAKEMRIAAKIAYRQLDLEKSKNDTKNLGWGKFVEPNIPLKLTEELEGPLRLLKPEGHILEDLLKNYQRRNILSARSDRKPQKKRKPKVFEKKRHKEIIA